MRSLSPGHTVPSSSSQTYSYQAFGLTLASSFPLPELEPQSGDADVFIHYGSVPDALEAAVKREIAYELAAGALLLKIPAIGKYLVLAGREIIVDPVPGVPDHEVRLFLLGSALGALFHQRGLLPLHGCALEVKDGAVIFLGESGSGKSTLAGALNQRGYRVITDDVSVLAFSPEEGPVVYPSCRHLKLCPDALREMGRDPAACSPVLTDLEKRYLPLDHGFCTQPRPVRRIYELASHDSPDFLVSPFQGLDKLTALIRHTYRLDFLEGPARRKQYFDQCGNVARQVFVGRFFRPRWPFALAEMVNFLDKEWGCETT
jgi:hypothetical protein